MDAVNVMLYMVVISGSATAWWISTSRNARLPLLLGSFLLQLCSCALTVVLLSGCFSEATLVAHDGNNEEPSAASTSDETTAGDSLSSSTRGGGSGGGETSSSSGSEDSQHGSSSSSSSDSTGSLATTGSSSDSGEPSAFVPCVDGLCDGDMACMLVTGQMGCGVDQECAICTFFCAGIGDASCPPGSECHPTRLYCVLPCGSCGDGEVCIADDPDFCTWESA